MMLLEVSVISTVIVIVFAADTMGEFKTKTEHVNSLKLSSSLYNEQSFSFLRIIIDLIVIKEQEQFLVAFVLFSPLSLI